LVAAGLEPTMCANLNVLCREIGRGAGVALLTEEAAEADWEGCLQTALRDQPPWSDFPLVVLAREVEGHQLRETMNVTLVERPVKMRSLLSVVRAALRARRRQYELRDHLAERARAAETIRQERERYRVTLSSIGDAVIATNVEGRVSFMNGVAETLTGWTLAEAVDRDLAEVFRIVNEVNRNPVENPTLRVLREGTLMGLPNHTLLIARDGKEWPIDDSAAPIYTSGGGLVGAVLVFRDTTEKRRAEQELRRKEFELTDFLENATIGLHWMGPDGTILWANQAEMDLLGYTREEFIGRNIAQFHADAPAIEDMLCRLTNKEKLQGYEARLRCKDGAILDVLIDSSVLWEGNRFVHTRCIMRDVTAQKRAEQELRESDRRKDDFIALLAHELRNPLAPVRNGLQVLRMAEKGASETASRAWSMMDRQLTHMVRLIDDLLDVSRINRNKMELRRSRVSLAEVVSSAVETARPLIEAAGHELTVTLPGVPVILDADPVRLAQVFSNLLANSAKYTEEGGRIRVRAEQRDGSVVVSVQDTGIGIPAASLPHIFDMFSQVDRSIERATGGLGIGLALVKGLVEMHGGTVAAESAGPGQGSVFTVTLPILVQDAPVETPPEAMPLHAVKRRVLVVDDSRDGAESMALMLQLLGDEVKTAYDGIEAVAQAEAFRPEVILMDVGMPRLNGLEATRQIRAQPWGKGMTIIALTGWGQEGDKERSREAGCDAHLVKPVSLPVLEALLAGKDRGKTC
jgi:PAS domain S-box-containing protein